MSSPVPASCKRHGKGFQWTQAELRRMHELAVIVGLPSGSIAKLLHHEFGTRRTPDAVRRYLHKHYNWKGVPRGDPSAIRK